MGRIQPPQLWGSTQHKAPHHTLSCAGAELPKEGPGDCEALPAYFQPSNEPKNLEGSDTQQELQEYDSSIWGARVA